MGKNCNNLKYIINKNLFGLTNKEKINKSELNKFNSLSLSEIKSEPKIMKNLKIIFLFVE